MESPGECFGGRLGSWLSDCLKLFAFRYCKRFGYKFYLGKTGAANGVDHGDDGIPLNIFIGPEKNRVLGTFYILLEKLREDRNIYRLRTVVDFSLATYGYDDPLFGIHVRHRRFVDYVERAIRGWRMLEEIPNRFPFDPDDSRPTSFANFYVFERQGA